MKLKIMNFIAKASRLKISSLILSVVFVAVFNCTANAAGELDTNFNASAYGTINGSINAVKKQPDGKILVGGFFSEANGVAAPGIARLNIDGSIDTSFNTQNLFNALGVGASVNAIAVQTDGKILVGGFLISPGGILQSGLIRINSDGSIDGAFNMFIVNGIIFDIEIQPDNKIVVGGGFTGPNATQNIVRLNSNGTVDATFSSIAGITVKDLEIQTDGRVIIGGFITSEQNFGIMRLTTGGS